jgi:hypothetical protein
MKIKDLTGFSPKDLVEARPYGDYFDDSGISARPGHDEGEPVYDPRYDRIGAGDPRGSGHYSSSSYHQPKMTGMYFYDVKPDQEEYAGWIGVKKTKSGKWALVQHDTSGATFNHKKRLADSKFGPGKFWSPKKESIEETASAGATSAASIGTVDAPHISPGKARGKKSYTGSPGTGSGTKAPPQPKVVQPKSKDGTAKNGLDIKGKSLFGGPENEAAVIKRH